MHHDEKEGHWVTAYPWLVDPSTLPNNYYSALATLRNTERRLLKDSDWAASYGSQIDEMLERGVARKLSGDEMDAWKSGSSNYR